MAQCAYCRAETQLCIGGITVCMDCEKSHSHAQVRARLVRDLAGATLRADSASETFHKVMKEVPSGMPHSDGIQCIKNISQQLAKAREEMMTAHKRLNKFIEHGVVPGDLKQG